MKLRELQSRLEKVLEKVTESWVHEAKIILLEVLGISTVDLIMDKEKEVPDEKVEMAEAIAVRRLANEPLQYILGKQAFMGLDFSVDDSVLIPRPETEVLVEWVLERIEDIKSPKVLDIGTGSGAIAISIAYQNTWADVFASDISSSAIEKAKQNAVNNNVSGRVRFFESNLFVDVSEKDFDLIVSNPPYIPAGEVNGMQREVALYEPHLALFGGEDGLDFYRRIIPEALSYMKDGGILIFEAGHDQADVIEAIMVSAGYEDVNHFSDLCGVPRFIYGKKVLWRHENV
ncbi:MAG: peptide chain release factor N(5)-glutamine methyltransferase [Clostridia bacterium]|nr:peptide chain release factor N(5)-glutamine methyltransferase [Clostridia bacterium]